MKLILKNVKIYGFDSTIFRTFNNDGKETKQYSVALYISKEDKSEIDKYLYNKVNQNEEGEFIFYGKSKQPIPIFNTEKNKITQPLNEVFIADVSIIINEFENDKGEKIRYSKCLGIKYLHKIENEQPKLPTRTYDNYDDIFSDEEEIKLPESDIKSEKKTENPIDDLPF